MKNFGKVFRDIFNAPTKSLYKESVPAQSRNAFLYRWIRIPAINLPGYASSIILHSSFNLPLNKLPPLFPLPQFFFQEPLPVFGDITTGEDVRDGYSEGDA